MDWKTCQRFPTSFLEVVIKTVSHLNGDRKKAKKLENWTLTPDEKFIPDWAVSLHAPDRTDDALSNEHIFRSTESNIRHRMTKRFGKVKNREPIEIQESATETRWNSTHLVGNIFNFIFVIDEKVCFYLNFSCISGKPFFSTFEKFLFLFNLIRISEKAWQIRQKSRYSK